MFMALGANLSNIYLFLPSPNCKRKERIGMVFPPESRRWWSGVGTARSLLKKTFSICRTPVRLTGMTIQKPLESNLIVVNPCSRQHLEERNFDWVKKRERFPPTIVTPLAAPFLRCPYARSVPRLPSPDLDVCSLMHSQASRSWRVLFPLPRTPSILSLLPLPTSFNFSAKSA